MFKELGAFIDHVGRATGRMIGRILSDKDDDDGMLMGDFAPDLDDDTDKTIININDEDE